MSRAAKGRRVGSRPFLFVTAALIAAVAGVFACSDSSQNVLGVGGTAGSAAPGPEGSKANPYAHVGTEHNAEVDFVLRQFAKRRAKSMSAQTRCSLLDQIVKEYLAGKKRSASDFRPAIEGALCGAERGVQSDLVAGSHLRAAAQYDDSFSPAALGMVNQISDLMLYSYSAADVANRLVPINNAALGSLSGNDAALVLGVSAVAQSSSAYWEANFGYWVSVFAPESGGTQAYLRSGDEDIAKLATSGHPSINWEGIKRVGWADVGGGILGGMRAAIGGPEAVALGAMGGAGWASIGAALGEIFKAM